MVHTDITYTNIKALYKYQHNKVITHIYLKLGNVHLYHNAFHSLFCVFMAVYLLVYIGIVNNYTDAISTNADSFIKNVEDMDMYSERLMNVALALLQKGSQLQTSTATTDAGKNLVDTGLSLIHTAAKLKIDSNILKLQAQSLQNAMAMLAMLSKSRKNHVDTKTNTNTKTNSNSPSTANSPQDVNQATTETNTPTNVPSSAPPMHMASIPPNTITSSDNTSSAPPPNDMINPANHIEPNVSIVPGQPSMNSSFSNDSHTLPTTAQMPNSTTAAAPDTNTNTNDNVQIPSTQDEEKKYTVSSSAVPSSPSSCFSPGLPVRTPCIYPQRPLLSPSTLLKLSQSTTLATELPSSGISSPYSSPFTSISSAFPTYQPSSRFPERFPESTTAATRPTSQTQADAAVTATTTTTTTIQNQECPSSVTLSPYSSNSPFPMYESSSSSLPEFPTTTTRATFPTQTTAIVTVPTTTIANNMPITGTSPFSRKRGFHTMSHSTQNGYDADIDTSHPPDTSRNSPSRWVRQQRKAQYHG